jgi:valyl-tRNA synthetase
LPRKSANEAPSICVTSYPTPNGEYAAFKNETVEKEFELAQKIISVVRSTRSDYNLPNKIK